MGMRVSHRRRSFGMKCVQCGDELIAPEKSDYRHEGDICHVWHCPKCCACFGAPAPSFFDISSMKSRRDTPPARMIASLRC